VVSVDVNAAADDIPDSLFLTLTGTSAEAGDDGEVGRGNRLITPYRPMNMETAAGKVRVRARYTPAHGTRCSGSRDRRTRAALGRRRPA
jgi:hypothetical protein